MSYIMVDIEADGPIPGTDDYSMICFGAVLVKPGLDTYFYHRLKPISDKWVPDALAVSGFSREETMEFPEPKLAMELFATWIKKVSNGRPRFVADNNGFDWMFICWYFQHFLGRNPFGFSSTNLGSLYKGLVGSDYKNFKHLRKTRHSHPPTDDAKGNAEAMLHMRDKMNLRIRLD